MLARYECMLKFNVTCRLIHIIQYPVELSDAVERKLRQTWDEIGLCSGTSDSISSVPLTHCKQSFQGFAFVNEGCASLIVRLSLMLCEISSSKYSAVQEKQRGLMKREYPGQLQPVLNPSHCLLYEN